MSRLKVFATGCKFVQPAAMQVWAVSASGRREVSRLQRLKAERRETPVEATDGRLMAFAVEEFRLSERLARKVAELVRCSNRYEPQRITMCNW